MNLDRIRDFVAAVDSAVSTDQAVALVEAFACTDGQTVEGCLDNVAQSVGQAFVSGSMDFGEAMRLMADIYNALFVSGLLITSSGESLCYQMYWALDEGETGHESDGDGDPIEARALPAVRLLLEQNSTK
jgi:hypothetical protein